MQLRVFLAGLFVSAALFLGGGSLASAQTPAQPPVQPADKTVTINPGDTLSSIAEANQTTFIRIFDANQQIENPDLIYAGQTLRIPASDEQLTDRPLPSAAPAVVSVPSTVSSYRATPVRRTVIAATLPADASVWDRLAQCESSGNWSTNTGNGFYGGLQFTPGSWAAVGGSGLPSQASREEQISRAQLLQQRQGWGAWPACSAKLGL